MANRRNSNPGDQCNPENSRHIKQVVISELLCYAFSNLQRCTGVQIVKAIDRFFNLDEIVCAKKVLYEIYSGDLGDFPKRKTSGNRSEQLAHVEDIVDSLILLDGKEDCISFNFVAHDLNRLPRFNPNETDNFAIAEKLAMLEARLQHRIHCFREQSKWNKK